MFLLKIKKLQYDNFESKINQLLEKVFVECGKIIHTESSSNDHHNIVKCMLY